MGDAVVPQGDHLPEDRLLSRRGSVETVLTVAVVLVLLAAPLFSLCGKALMAGILATEARTALEASATCAFPCLAAAQLAGTVGEAEMQEFRTMLGVEVDRNTDGGPLAGCVVDVGAEREADGSLTCTLRYVPGNLGRGIFGDAVPEVATVSCGVSLPTEP